jgi:protein-disulfide isomerase
MTGIHREARAVAVASVCADRFGKFEIFHDLLFSKQDSIPFIPVARFAALAGIQDTVLFSSCIADDSANRVIERDIAAAKELGVEGTPTILVNQYLVIGNPGADGLDSLVGVALTNRE